MEGVDGLFFWVAGCPAPQGSKVRTPYGMREASKHVPAWREAVRSAAVVAMDADDGFVPVAAGAVRLDVQFVFKRPTGHYRSGARWTELRPRFVQARRSYRPDVDKLARAVMDALTAAGVWSDDAQVDRLVVEKVWSGSRTTEGAWIRIHDMEMREKDECADDEASGETGVGVAGV
jgi:crossover junction endodeoxyribonuclease RusA